MRWGLRGSRQQPREAAQHPRRDQEQQDSKGKKSKAVFSSFSPLAWLSKLTARNSGAAAAKPPEQAMPVSVKSTAQPTVPFPHNFHKRASTTSPASASQSSPSGSSSSSAATVAAGTAPRREGGAGADTAAADTDVAPRRRSVGNDDAESDTAAARRHLCRRRHYSVGGDRDLLPLGHLISLSRFASPKPPPTPAPVRTLTPPPTLPPLLSESDTDEDEKRPPRSRRRRPRRAGGRRSFSSYGKVPGGARVARVRSPRVSELERFAVVRRTRDPQREFRASMVEMIASKRMVGRPEELETLLACYLSLNADEHHDCIVKVFRQVWFELNNNNSTRAQAAAAAPSPRS